MRELAGREIGARIAQARSEAGGMTQQELADLLGVTMRSVQNYESGDTIPWRHFQHLGEIFNRSLSWFLHGEEQVDATGEAAAAYAELLEEVRQLRERSDRIEALLRQALQDRPDEPPDAEAAAGGS